MTGTLTLLRENAGGASISPDGERIAFVNGTRNEIWMMKPDGEAAEKVLTTEKGYAIERLVWAPERQRLAFVNAFRWARRAEIKTFRIGEDKAALILSEPRLRDFAWSSDGRILYAVSEPPPNEYDSNLWEIHVNPKSGKPSSSPRRITDWLGISPTNLSMSADGKRLAFLNWRTQSDIYVGELEAKGAGLRRVSRLTVDERIDWPGGWTRDAKSILFYSNRNGRLDLFQQTPTNHIAAILLAGPEEKRLPQVSPDGAWILYLAWVWSENSAPPSSGKLMRLSVSGGRPEFVMEVRGYPGTAEMARSGTVLTAQGHPDLRCPSAASASCILTEVDGDQLVFTAVDPVAGRRGELARVGIHPTGNTFWDVTPDGSRLVYGHMANQSNRLWWLPLSGGPAREISVKGWTRFTSASWSADGGSLFVTRRTSKGGWLLHVSPDGTAVSLRTVTGSMERPLPSPDGRFLAFGEVNTNSNAWMIEDVGIR